MRHALAVLLSLTLLAAPAAAADSPPEDGYAKGLELFRAGRYEAALPYFQEALDLARNRYGKDSPAVAVELNNLAEVYRLMGRMGEAEKLYKQAIELDEGQGGESTGLATSLNNLALVYRAQKKYGEAEKLYERSLRLLEKSLGPSHPDVARALNNLAVLYRMKGEPERAQPLQARALAIAEDALGQDHPTTQVLRRNLAALDKGPAPAKATAAAPQPASVPAAMPEPPVAAAARLEEPPAPVPVAVAPAAAADSTFALQLAAVPDAGQVGGEWKRLLTRFPPLRELELKAPQSVEVPGKGTFYRVIAGSFATRADAEAMCARLREAGAACRLARP
jgi:tetratricopeptide (TPR) repeat protein